MPNAADRHRHPPARLQAMVGEMIAERQRNATAPIPGVSALECWLGDIHAELEREPGFADRVTRVRQFVPGPGFPTCSLTLAQTPDYRLNLIGVHRLKPVPMHDHPEGAGVQLVLSGRARIGHFDLAPHQLPGDGLARLEWVGERERRSGDLDTYLPLRSNIHHISAISTTAVLLCLQLPPCRIERQCWYFPLELLGDDEPELLCSRVLQRRPALRRDRPGRITDCRAAHRELRM